MNVKLFKNQTVYDAVMEDITCMLNCTRVSLNIFAVGKGVVIGNLTFKKNGYTFDCTKQCK